MARRTTIAVALLGAATSPATAAINPDDPVSVRDAYAATIVSNRAVPTGWTGSVAGCNPGAESYESAAATIADVNFFREMNRLAPVTLASPDINAKAQAAALMFEANNQLSHTPPAGWACYTQAGADAANRSNIALGIGGPGTVSAYVEDAGDHNEAVGHRRWMLAPQARVFGTGSTSRAQAMWVMQTSATLGPRPGTDLVAWPPQGHVPWPLVYDRWSVSSNLAPNADYSAATVTVSTGGANLPVRVLAPHNGYGDNTIAFSVAIPAELRSAGAPTAFDVTVANVRVDGVPRTIAYRTTAIGVDTSAAPNGVAATVSGGTVTVNWNAPLARPDLAVGYRATLVDAAGNQIAATDHPSETRSATFGGLADGTYRVDIRALTAAGPEVPAARTVVVGKPTMAPMAVEAPPPVRRAGSALRGVRVVRAGKKRVARLALRDRASVVTSVQRWSPARRRWVAARSLGRRGLDPGVRPLPLGTFRRGHYRVVVTTPATDTRSAARLAVRFTVR